MAGGDNSVSALTAMAAWQTGTSSVDENKMLEGVTLKRVPQDALVAKKCRRRKVEFARLGFR